MSLSPAVLRWSMALAVIAVAAAGLFAGMRAGSLASEPGVEELRFVDPNTLETTLQSAAKSAGGFTGFGGAPALSGDVLRTGSLASVDADGIRVDEPAASLNVVFEDGTRRFRIAPVSTPLAPGDRVVVRTEDSQVTGVLRVR